MATFPVTFYTIGECLGMLHNAIAIDLFPILQERPLDIQKSVCIHEAWHIIAQHSLEKQFFSFIIQEHSFKDPVDVENCHAFKNFISIQEKQADMCPALLDKTAADYMEKKRAFIYHPQINSPIEHYKNLCTIKSLWERYAILEKIKHQYLDKETSFL